MFEKGSNWLNPTLQQAQGNACGTFPVMFLISDNSPFVTSYPLLMAERIEEHVS